MKKTSLANASYSVAHPIMYNVKSRKRVAIQAYKVLTHFLKRRDISNLSCLDIGCSTGIITSYLAPFFKKTVGIDVDKDAISFAQKTHRKDGITFKVVDGGLTFPANSFDIVICQEVYENADKPEDLLNQIYRVLKPKGICYFTGDNLLFPIESQYDIPFFLYLPDSIAKIILRFLGHKKFYLGHFKTYWGLRQLCKKFIVHDYTLPIILNPKIYEFTRLYKYKTFANFLPKFVLSFLYFLVPTFIWVLEKRGQSSYGKTSLKEKTLRFP